jgi:hypothetical protein
MEAPSNSHRSVSGAYGERYHDEDRKVPTRFLVNHVVLSARPPKATFATDLASVR